MVKRRKLVGLILSLMLALLCGCGAKPGENRPSATTLTEAKTACERLEDDWVAFFTYRYVEGERHPFLYSFSIRNLRYRFNASLSESLTIQTGKEGEKVYEVAYFYHPVRSWFSENEARKKDLDSIQELFQRNLSPEQMLTLDRGSVHFQELDSELFFRLMEEALNGESQESKEVSPRELFSSYAMETEADYLDGYRFQICYYGKYGYLEGVFIDVLYKTGTDFRDYEQLSDLVRSGRADNSQIEAYQLFQKLEQRSVEQNRFDIMNATEKDEVLGKIDFYRLFTFLQALETGDLYMSNEVASRYVEPIHIIKREEITEEEYRKTHSGD